MRTFLILLFLVSLQAAAAAPDAACFVEIPPLSPEEIAARKARAAESEARARKLIQGFQAHAKSSSGAQARTIRTQIQQLDTVVDALRKLQEREYCDTSSPAASAYVTEVTRRLEECGTRNFASEKGRRSYGSAEAEFVLDAGGQLFSDRILEASKTAAIDEHVSRLIRASAPFGAVPEALSAGKYRHFVFRSTFSFVQGADEKVTEPRVRCRL